MKKILLIGVFILIAFGLVACGPAGQKTGFVNCCVKAADSVKCYRTEPGQCAKTVGATVVNNCDECK